jgi:hypothetical protein
VCIGRQDGKQECSFLKKRTKKLLSVSDSAGRLPRGPAAARNGQKLSASSFKNVIAHVGSCWCEVYNAMPAAWGGRKIQP